MTDSTPATAAQRCSTCRHWDQEGPRGGWHMEIRLTHLPGEDEDDYSAESPYQKRVQGVEARYGRCRAITLLDSYEANAEADVPIAFTRDGSDYKANLYSRDDFGCTLWEAQDGT